MARTADYTIQGFHYQFNKTLLEILKAKDDSIINVEGIIEDIEIVDGDIISAIQCKYHETNTAYTASAIYKPLLQMMHHFHYESKGKISYVLFAHFPGLTQTDFTVSRSDLEAAIASKNKDFIKYVRELRDVIDIDAFLLKFSTSIGPPYDTLVSQVCDLLQAAGFSAIDVKTLSYPNAIHLVACLSIKHDASKRKTSRSMLISELIQIKTTAISHWTLSLKSKKELLAARRKQLAPNLSKNSRLRYFLIHGSAITDFDSDIVLFIDDYIDKYHFKTAHVKTPLFCIDATDDQFQAIVLRLHQKGLAPNAGYVANVFDQTWFLREPMTQKGDGGIVKREFQLRLLNWRREGHVLNVRKSDDLFVIGNGGFDDINITDVNVEELATGFLDEIKYMIGLTDVCE
jgi:hypothetical protein